MESRRKIVIVEDNEAFAALLAAALEEEFDISVGHNGLEGLALCQQGGVSAVVTDIGMPEMDAIAMLKEFSRYPDLSVIPVIVVTATHFTRRSRSEVSKFQQVKRLLSKTSSIDNLAAEVRAVLGSAPGRSGLD
ncbi:MAG: response regulator [Elusimicrobiales bacterium]|nr:response regulator [Elusimicrobiales bacterium]